MIQTLLIVKFKMQEKKHLLQSMVERRLKIRFRKYSEKVATSLSHCDPKVLPPTAAAAKFHSYCVFLQLNKWKNIDCCMTETSWGWKQHENEFKPIATDIVPAPAD